MNDIIERQQEFDPLEAWASFYLNYDDLLMRMKNLHSEWGLRKAISTRSMKGETRTFAEILDSETHGIHLNPNKSELIKFAQEDKIIVLTES